MIILPGLSPMIQLKRRPCFRNNIIHKGLHERLFREINRQLEKHGIKVKEAKGALLDATIVTSAARPKKIVESDHSVKQPADPSWLKKRKQSYFGYRGYFVFDNQEGLIHHIHVRPANECEVTPIATDHRLYSR